MRIKLMTMTTAAALAASTLISATASDNPNTPSQLVECNQVDKALSHIPHGDGAQPVADAETGPGGWRYNGAGMSFVSFEHELDPTGQFYVVFAGRSRVGSNSTIINDYPAVLDLPQTPQTLILTFKGRHGVIILTGDAESDPPLFALPGAGEGEVRINMSDPDGDGVFEGCAERPLLKNFGFVKPEGGDFVQIDYFKAYAETDMDGTVTFFEWTEVSTFKNTEPDAN